MYGFCYIHMHYQTGLFISPMNVCSSNKFCACNLFTLIDTPAVSSCLPFFANLSLSNFVGFLYSFLTPASVVWLLSSCAAPVTFPHYQVTSVQVLLFLLTALPPVALLLTTYFHHLQLLHFVLQVIQLQFKHFHSPTHLCPIIFSIFSISDKLLNVVVCVWTV